MSHQIPDVPYHPRFSDAIRWIPEQTISLRTIALRLRCRRLAIRNHWCYPRSVERLFVGRLKFRQPLA
jgi:hypothetical protein